MNNKTEDQFSLEKFSPLIAELESKASMYLSLTINWIDDKENQVVVQKAKMEVVRLRTSIEDFAKEIRDPHTQFNRLVSEKEKELIAKIEPVEKHLKAEQEKVKQELKRIEEEEKEKAKKIFEERIKKLSEIKCIPDNLFAIWNMTDEEFDLYYQTKFNEYQLNEQIQFWLNMISSCVTLEQLEELHHHDETFLETYQTQQFKEAFEKRFNEINNEIKRQDELKQLRIKQEEQQRVSNSINTIITCQTLEELKSLKDIEDVIEVRLAYETRKQFLEQQEELNKMKAEQEEKRKQEEDEQKRKQQEEEQKRKLKETRIADLRNKIFKMQTEEELKELYFKEDIQDIILEVRDFFTTRKKNIIEEKEFKQKQKDFQDYLQSINYNKEDCIIQEKQQGDILIYKLIWKWNK